MAVKKFSPTSPARRFMTVSTFEEITRKKPEKSLVKILKKTGGRNAWQGYRTPQGRRNKTQYRIIDFKRIRTAFRRKWRYRIRSEQNSEYRAPALQGRGKRYILAPVGLNVGILSNRAPTRILPGNTLPLVNIPVGTMIHNIELKPGKGGQLVRSAGNAAQLMARRAIMPRCGFRRVK